MDKSFSFLPSALLALFLIGILTFACACTSIDPDTPSGTALPSEASPSAEETEDASAKEPFSAATPADVTAPAVERTAPPADQTAAAIFVASGSWGSLINEPEGLNEYFDYAEIPENHKKLVSAKITYIGDVPQTEEPLFAYGVNVFYRWDPEKNNWDFETSPKDHMEEIARGFADLGLLVVTNYEACNFYSMCLAPKEENSYSYDVDFILAGTEAQVCACFQYGIPIHDWYFRVFPAAPGTLPSEPVPNDIVSHRRLLKDDQENSSGIQRSVYLTAPVTNDIEWDPSADRHQAAFYEDVFEAGGFFDKNVYLAPDEAEKYTEPLYAFTLQAVDYHPTDGGELHYSELCDWLSGQGLLVLDAYDACGYYDALTAGSDVLAATDRHPYADLVFAGSLEQIRQIFSEDAPSFKGFYFHVHPAMYALYAKRMTVWYSNQ